MRIELTGGAYTARSVIANAQRCVNLFPERNPEEDESPVRVTHYQTPGLLLLGTAPVQTVFRGLYRATSNDLYGVVGSGVYYIAPNWTFTLLGNITNLTAPVYMSDNGTTILLVDGTANGYTINLATRAFAGVVDPNFLGSDRVDTLDTFLLLNQPGTATWYCSLSNSVSFNALDFAQKTAFPDKVIGVVAIHREVWVIGDLTTEIWYDAGAAGFPFQEMPGAIVEHGCGAKYSIAKQDLAVYWLSKDQQGQGMVVRGQAYEAKRISTHAIEEEFRKYSRIDDAIGMIYQQDGHVFYVLTFPTADKTWCFDEATGQWHERVWKDGNGQAHRHRMNCIASAYGKIVVGDHDNGNLYALDVDTYTDNGAPIERIRGFPHLLNDGKRMMFTRFVADMEVGADTGAIDGTTAANPPVVSLRYSDTRGQSWGNRIQQTLGAAGEYYRQVQFQRLGMARDRVFELSWSVPTKTALNGAFVDAVMAET